MKQTMMGVIIFFSIILVAVMFLPAWDAVSQQTIESVAMETVARATGTLNLSGNNIAQNDGVTGNVFLRRDGLEAMTGSLSFGTGLAVRTGTTAGNTVLLQARDTDGGGSWTTLCTMTAGSTPSLSCAGPTITGSPTAAGATWADLGTVTTADINGGTVDAITSLTVANNVDIGGYDIRALSGTFDSLTSGRVPLASTNGLLIDDADVTFATQTLTATAWANSGTVPTAVGTRLGRTATLTVCASNALSTLQCDYVSDNTNDNLDIDTAVAALPSTGGHIVLSDGTFTFGAGLTNWTKYVWLQGQGATATVINCPTGAVTCISINSGGATAEWRGQITDLNIVGLGSASSKGIYVEDATWINIARNWIDNFDTNVHITGNSFLAMLVDNEIKRCGTTCVQGDDIAGEGPTGARIQHNRMILKNGGSYDLDWGGDDSFITDNYFETASVGTFTAAVRLLASAARNTVAGNIFDMNDTMTNTIQVVAGATDNLICGNENMLYPTAAAALSDAGTRTWVCLNPQGPSNLYAFPATLPSTPVTGQISYSSTAGKMLYRDASIWRSLRQATTIASDTLRISNDTEKTTTSGSYTKLKVITLNENLDAGRLKVEVKVTAGSYNLRFRKNNESCNLDTAATSGSEVAYTTITLSPDLGGNACSTGLTAGDTLEVWVKDAEADGSTISLQNFRIYYDIGAVTISASSNDP